MFAGLAMGWHSSIARVTVTLTVAETARIYTIWEQHGTNTELMSSFLSRAKHTDVAG